MKTLLAPLLLTLLSSTATAAPATGGDWLPDFDAAQALVSKGGAHEGKLLLVDFTGSDWCGWCIRLHDEVFAHESWQVAAEKDYVFVSLDFPRDPKIKAKVPNPKRNAELQAKYGVQGFPAILILTPDGEVLGRTGYQAGGPEAYLKHMTELRTKGQKELADNRQLVDALSKAEGDAWVPAWQAVVDKLRRFGADKPGSSLLIAGVREAFDRDPENKLGILAQAVVVSLSLGEADAALLAASIRVDPKNEAGLREHALYQLVQAATTKANVESAMPHVAAFHAVGKRWNDEHAFQIYLLGAYWAKSIMKDLEAAKLYARQGLDIGTKNAEYRGALESILKS
jgi:thiol-disulfide isomerase/thioredoxin